MSLFTLLSAHNGVYEDAEGNEFYSYAKVWTAYAKDNLQSIFLYVAIALAVILIAVGIFVRYRKIEALTSYVRTALALAMGFAISVILTMLSLEFLEMQEKGYIFHLILNPTVVLAVVLVLSVAAVYVAHLFGKKPFKITAITALSCTGAALIALFICLNIYFYSGEAEINNGVEITVSENVALYFSTLAVIAVIVFLAFFFGRGDRKGFDSKAISYAAVCIAMSFALSYLSPIKMPQGGSVTIASLLPLMLYSYMFGVKKGVFAGLIYGILQAVQDPWIIHPAQFLLDYPVAFAGIGLAGIFAKQEKLRKFPQIQFALGAVIASALRFISHVLSGVFAFSEYAYNALGEPMNAWLYSLGYNSFVFVDIAIAIAVGVLILSSRGFVKQLRKFNAPKKETEETETTEEQ